MTARRRILLTGCLALPFMIAAIISPLPAHAQLKKDTRKDFVVTLDNNNIQDFLREVSDISTGNKPEMLDEDVANYFQNHVAEKAEFKSAIQYQIPSYPAKEAEMKLNKEEYIATVIKGRFMMENYKTDIQLSDMKIAGNGKSATFTSTTIEKGKMPWIKDENNKEDVEYIPIEGKSVCEQRLIVSYNNFIQMAKADCDTVISFDPFGDKPLVP